MSDNVKRFRHGDTASVALFGHLFPFGIELENIKRNAEAIFCRVENRTRYAVCVEPVLDSAEPVRMGDREHCLLTFANPRVPIDYIASKPKQTCA